MLKSLDAGYSPGERVDHSVKLKFVKSADVVVLTVNRPDAKHGSATFGVVSGPWSKWEHDEFIGGVGYRTVGGCSLIGKPEVVPGDVIEVNYLYWTGEALYQPRMMQVRIDKDPAECLVAQFPIYTREVLA